MYAPAPATTHHPQAKLREIFETDTVSVEDNSGGCGSSYVVECTSVAFKGLSTLKQHRLVTNALKAEVSDMHAIRVFTQVPDDE